MKLPLDSRPVVVAVAGPNGAGKSTFYESHLSQCGLRFINADHLAQELGLGPYEAAEAANQLRRELLSRRESFVFETVFSDPAGDKLAFLREAAAGGYAVILCFIGLDSPETAEGRVAMRVLQGGHDVPTGKVRARFRRTLANLDAALRELPHVMVFDNSSLRRPYRLVAEVALGRVLRKKPPISAWLHLPKSR